MRAFDVLIKRRSKTETEGREEDEVEVKRDGIVGEDEVRNAKTEIF